MFSTLNLYIAKQFLLGILTAFVVITGVIILVDFVEISRSEDGVSFATAFVLTALKAPKLIEETIPFVVLFGVMSALFKLNRRSELIIMRAAGLSAWRFLMPGLIVAGLIGVLWASVLNPLAVKSNAKFESKLTAIGKTLPAQKTGEATGQETLRNIWLAEGGATGQTKIYAKRADLTERTLHDAVFYLFRYDADKVAEFTNRFDAKTAMLSDEGYWVLTDVVDTPADGGKALPYESSTLPTNITGDDLREATNSRPDPSFWGLVPEIKRLSEAGFSATPLIMKFHKLLALPLTLIAMAVIAACASMQLTRLGGALRLMVTGAALGFGVYFANNMVNAFGETGSLPAILAAWAVPAFVLLAGLARLTALEDG
ncbi:MAG: LptF/LptG family permease [Robiginitomaculum sp.]